MFNIDFSKISYEEIHQLSFEKLSAAIEPWERDIWQFIRQFTDNVTQAIEVTTSGSTGVPKKIEHAKTSVLNSAAATCKALRLKQGDTALLCLPANKIGGMMMIARSIYMRLNLVCIRPSSTPLSDFSNELKIDFAAFTPMQFYEILNSEQAFEKAKQISNILLGGQDIGAKLLQLIQTMPNNVYHTFGMTETISHIALKKLSGSTIDKFYTTLPGVTVETDERGCLVIKAPLINQPHLSTNDVVNIISPTQFEWLGRIDNVINSGGLKIYPEEIEQQLQARIDKPFFIAGLPDEKTGSKLVLVIEAESLSEAEKSNLNEAFNGLDKFQKPREILVVNSFERTENGKVKRTESLSKILGNT